MAPAGGVVIYRSAAGAAAVAEAYDAWLGRLPVAVDSLVVPTRFGNAHVITAGDHDPTSQRPAVVALAGTNFPALAWGSLLPLASRGCRVFAVDLIGQPGRSTGPRLQTSGADYVDWVDDVLDGLDLPAASLVGHSLGGHVALRFTAARPRRTRRLALVCPSGLIRLRVPPAVLTRTLAWLARPQPATSRALLRLMSQPGQDVEDLVDWMTVVARHVRTSLAPPPLPAHVLREVTRPVLVLAGERDPFLPGHRLAEAARQRLPASQAIVIPGGSHLLPHDQPTRVAALLTHFLEGPEQP